jgi:hypothetical protein
MTSTARGLILMSLKRPCAGTFGPKRELGVDTRRRNVRVLEGIGYII